MIIEVRPGEGGEDAVAFANELFDMAVDVTRLSGHPISNINRTPRILTFEHGGTESPLGLFAGTHRVQRIPKGSAARHTSTATLVVLREHITVGG